MNNGLLILLFSLILSKANGSEKYLQIKPVFGLDEIIKLDTNYQSHSEGTIKFKTLKFYLSDLKILDRGEIIFIDPVKFHLVDLEDNNSLSIPFPAGKSSQYSTISFTLGVDSITNVSGIYGGDLDPIHGMYWTWQSGYINFKLEGSHSTFQSESKDFEFHLGGYQYPFNAMQEISLATKGGQINEIKLDLLEFMNDVDLAQRNHIMSPCSEAVRLSKILSKCFHVN